VCRAGRAALCTGSLSWLTGEEGQLGKKCRFRRARKNPSLRITGLFEVNPEQKNRLM